MPDKSNRDLTLLILAATALGVLDSFIPRPLPFMKIGFANIVAVIAVVKYGFLKTLELNLFRVFAVALITGLLVTPSFLLSISGAVFSTVVMSTLRFFLRDGLSTIGLSIAGAVSSLWAQIFVAGLILSGLPLQNIVLLLTLWGIVSGAAVGFLAQEAIRKGSKFEVLRKVRG